MNPNEGGLAPKIGAHVSPARRARQNEMRKPDLKCERLKHAANGPIGLRTTQTRCERSDQSCEQRKRVAIGPIWVANNANALRSVRNGLR